MSFIYKLPQGLTYTLKTVNGKKVSILDMTKTAVNTIPKGLKGVDQVVVNAGQLQYIAYDYRGKVMVAYPTTSCEGEEKSIEPMFETNVQLLKQNYGYAIRVDSPLYFESSLLNQYGHEQHLPSNLIFDKETRILDASKTVLMADSNDKKSLVKGVFGWILPSRYWVEQDNRLRHQKNVLDKKGAKKTHGATRAKLGWPTKSAGCPDRLV